MSTPYKNFDDPDFDDWVRITWCIAATTLVLLAMSVSNFFSPADQRFCNTAGIISSSSGIALYAWAYINHWRRWQEAKKTFVDCAYFRMTGRFEVKACDEAKVLVEHILAFKTGCFEANYEDSGDGTALVEFASKKILNNEEASFMEGKMQELMPYVLTPMFIERTKDGELVRTYAGPPGQEAQAESNEALAAIAEWLPDLTVADREEVKRMIDELDDEDEEEGQDVVQCASEREGGESQEAV